ncbi:MAG: glycosyltransferase, partial [Saprospiraceae bacterium]|nr:glycosyltransferase [Saprospiraceae bacterium]
ANGFLCAPNEPTDYVRRIQQLLEDKNLHQQFVEAGLKYSKSLSWDDLAATYFYDLEAMAARPPVTNQPG